MNMSISGTHWRTLVLVSISTVVLSGAKSGCQKKNTLTTPGIPRCNTINITPGDASVRPKVDHEVCAIAPGESVTWVCDIDRKACANWQVVFEDSSVDNTKLFVGGATKFPDPPGPTTSTASATLVNTLVPHHGDRIKVKYTVYNGSKNKYDPHIVPMGP